MDQQQLDLFDPMNPEPSKHVEEPYAPDEPYATLPPHSWMKNKTINGIMKERFYQLRREGRIDDSIAIAREFKV